MEKSGAIISVSGDSKALLVCLYFFQYFNFLYCRRRKRKNSLNSNVTAGNFTHTKCLVGSIPTYGNNNTFKRRSTHFYPIKRLKKYFYQITNLKICLFHKMLVYRLIIIFAINLYNFAI